MLPLYVEEPQQRNSLQVGLGVGLEDGGERAPFRNQSMCAMRKRKNNTDYAEAVRQGANS